MAGEAHLVAAPRAVDVVLLRRLIAQDPDAAGDGRTVPAEGDCAAIPLVQVDVDFPRLGHRSTSERCCRSTSFVTVLRRQSPRERFRRPPDTGPTCALLARQ